MSLLAVCYGEEKGKMTIYWSTAMVDSEQQQHKLQG